MFSLAFLHVWFGCFVCKSRPRLRKAVCLQCVQHTLCTHQLQRQAFCTCDDNMDPAKKSKAGRKQKVKRGKQKCDSVDQKLSKPERKRNRARKNWEKYKAGLSGQSGDSQDDGGCRHRYHHHHHQDQEIESQSQSLLALHKQEDYKLDQVHLACRTQ